MSSDVPNSSVVKYPTASLILLIFALGTSALCLAIVVPTNGGTSDVLKNTFVVTGGMAMFATFVLVLLRLANGSRMTAWSAREVEIPAAGSSSHRSRRRITGWIGLVLLGAGVAVVAIATPIDNVVVKEAGTRHFSVPLVSGDHSTEISTKRLQPLLHHAATYDVDLSFAFRLASPPLRASTGVSMMVSTLAGPHGIGFELVGSGIERSLLATTGAVATLKTPAVQTLIAEVPPNQWIQVSASVTRNQSYVYKVNGRPIQAFTWNVPILNVDPSHLLVDSSFGGSIRHTELVVALYRRPSAILYAATRIAQILGLAAVALGIFLIARRMLPRLIPIASGVRRPLVLIAFGTAGLGIIINVMVDLLHLQRSPLPYFGRNSWLVSQYPRFADFFQALQILRTLNPYGILSGNYPPVGYWLTAPFIWMNDYAGVFVFLAAMIGFLLWWFSRSFTSGLRKGERIMVVAVAMLSLPVTFATDRANLDLVVFVTVVIGIAAVDRQRNSVAATWLGLAAAAKIFPALYLLTFLRGGRLRYLMVGVGVAIAATVLAFLGFTGTLAHNIRSLVSAQGVGAAQSAVAVSTTYFNASLAGFSQAIGYGINRDAGDLSVMRTISPFIFPMELVGTLLLVWYIRWKEESLWRATTLITVAFLLLSDLSNYYALIFLFVPLALFLKYATINRRTVSIAVLFGLSLAPHSYFYFGDNFVDFSVLVTAPLLCALGISVICDGIRERSGNSAVQVEPEQSVSQEDSRDSQSTEARRSHAQLS